MNTITLVDEQVEKARILALYQMVKLEVMTGMKSRIPAMGIAKELLGLGKNAKKEVVLEGMTKLRAQILNL